MDVIYVGQSIDLNWSIRRNASEVLEDFSRADLKVFLTGNDFDGNYDGKYYFANHIDEQGRVVLDIDPGSLTPGTYCIEGIWIKNSHELLNSGWTRSISRARKDRIFKVSDVESECTDYNEEAGHVVAESHEINIATGTTSYGYDGMSAYETAIFNGSTAKTEKEWIDTYEKAEDRVNYEMDESHDGSVPGEPQSWANAELKRKQAEGQLGSSDPYYSTSRQKKEADRQTAESNRVSAENSRSSAETQRQKNEGQLGSSDPDYATSRIKKENDRQTAESGRASAESGRVSAENTRVQNEGSGGPSSAGYSTSRIKKELDRQSAESSRATAEASRQEYEGQGDYSDTTEYPNTRRAKEAARQTAETSRATAETARQKAEGQLGDTDPDYATSRIKQEIDRQAAEAARELAETARENAKISSTTIEYAVGDSGTTPPSSGWQSTVPSYTTGDFLWGRTTITFGDGTSKVLYAIGSVPDVAVSQNASTGKTTITVGSDSYDVATEPVSVSQKTLTIGGTPTDIKVVEFSDKLATEESYKVGIGTNIKHLRDSRFESLYGYDIIAIDNTIDGTYLVADGEVCKVRDVTGFPNYAVDVFDVSSYIGKTIHIQGELMGNVIIAGFFDSSSLENLKDSSHCIGGIFDAVTETLTNYDYTIKVPFGASVLCLSRYTPVGYWNVSVKSSDGIIEQILSGDERLTPKILNNTYININYLRSNPNYKVWIYDVSDKTFTKIKLNGLCKGSWTCPYAFFSTDNITLLQNSSVAEVYLLDNELINDNDNYTIIDKVVTVPQGAKVLALSIPLEVESSYDVAYWWLSDTKLISGLIKQTNYSANKVWELKSDVDKMLQESYSNNYINMLKQLNDRYDSGNVRLTEDFTVPQIGGGVGIGISANPQYQSGSENINFFRVNDLICIGSKQLYDIYQVKTVYSGALYIQLLVCNSGMVGATMPANTVFTNETTLDTVTVNTRIYKYEDIRAYESDETPLTFVRDGVHPTTTGNLLLGKIFATNLLSKFGTVNRVIAFGDSWTAGSNGWYDGITDVIPNCTIVNKGVSSDRVEHIIKRFKDYMENDYQAESGDVFLFVMGTNNLLQASNLSNSAVGLWNKSYVSVFRDACGIISTYLSNGNWMVANGHSRPTVLK